MSADAIHVARVGHGLASRSTQPRAQDFFKLHVTGKDWEGVPQLHFAFITARIFAQDAFKPFGQTRESSPGLADRQAMTKNLMPLFREHCLEALSPCGTAGMGRSDDPQAGRRSSSGPRDQA